MVDVGRYIDEVYRYEYPGCVPFIAYGFAETRIEVGTVEPGDAVRVEHLRDGVSSGPAYAAAYPADMLCGRCNGAPLEEGALRDEQGVGDLANVYVDFLASPSLELRVDRDAVLVTESARVTVGGVTDPDAVVTLSAETPYGRLVRVASGDTTAISGPLAWSEIERSEVLFVADGAWPEADVKVTVRATDEDGTTSAASFVLVAARALDRTRHRPRDLPPGPG